MKWLMVCLCCSHIDVGLEMNNVTIWGRLSTSLLSLLGPEEKAICRKFPNNQQSKEEMTRLQRVADESARGIIKRHTGCLNRAELVDMQGWNEKVYTYCNGLCESSGSPQWTCQKHLWCMTGHNTITSLCQSESFFVSIHFHSATNVHDHTMLFPSLSLSICSHLRWCIFHPVSVMWLVEFCFLIITQDGNVSSIISQPNMQSQFNFTHFTFTKQICLTHSGTYR